MSVCSHKYNEAWSTLSVKQNTHMLSSTFSVSILSYTDVTRVWNKAQEKIIVLKIPYPFSSQTQHNTVVTTCVDLPCTPPDCNEVSGNGVTRAHTPRSNTPIETLKYNRRVEYIYGWELFLIERS